MRASRLTGARLEEKLATFHQTFGIESVEMLTDGPTRRGIQLTPSRLIVFRRLASF